MNHSDLSDARLVYIARNPSAGKSSRGEKIAKLAEALENRGFEVAVESDLDLLSQRVMDAQANHRLKAVVAAGGDGTIRLLAERLGKDVDYAVYPLGTENLLAKFLNISGDVQSFCDMLVQGRRVRMDAGRANGKLFLIMVSCGFDAEVVARLHAIREGNISHRDYFGPLWQTIRHYNFPPLRVTVDGVLLEPAPWVFVFNLPRYAMNLPLAPMALGDDGVLDVKIFRRGNFWNGLLNYLAVWLRQDTQWTLSRHLTGKSITIESDVDVAFQLDGDPGGNLPVSVDVLPRYLSFYSPASVN